MVSDPVEIRISGFFRRHWLGTAAASLLAGAGVTSGEEAWDWGKAQVVRWAVSVALSSDNVTGTIVAFEVEHCRAHSEQERRAYRTRLADHAEALTGKRYGLAVACPEGEAG